MSVDKVSPSARLRTTGRLLCHVQREVPMKQSQHFLENAENCAKMAERAPDEPSHKRYKRMEAAWRALATEQDWLDGQMPPVRIATGGPQRNTSAL
jgi:hypothetical protein